MFIDLLEIVQNGEQIAFVVVDRIRRSSARILDRGSSRFFSRGRIRPPPPRRSLTPGHGIAKVGVAQTSLDARAFRFGNIPRGAGSGGGQRVRDGAEQHRRREALPDGRNLRRRLLPAVKEAGLAGPAVVLLRGRIRVEFRAVRVAVGRKERAALMTQNALIRASGRTSRRRRRRRRRSRRRSSRGRRSSPRRRRGGFRLYFNRGGSPVEAVAKVFRAKTRHEIVAFARFRHAMFRGQNGVLNAAQQDRRGQTLPDDLGLGVRLLVRVPQTSLAFAAGLLLSRVSGVERRAVRGVDAEEAVAGVTPHAVRPRRVGRPRVFRPRGQSQPLSRHLGRRGSSGGGRRAPRRGCTRPRVARSRLLFGPQTPAAATFGVPQNGPEAALNAGAAGLAAGAPRPERRPATIDRGLRRRRRPPRGRRGRPHSGRGRPRAEHRFGSLRRRGLTRGQTFDGQRLIVGLPPGRPGRVQPPALFVGLVDADGPGLVPDPGDELAQLGPDHPHLQVFGLAGVKVDVELGLSVLFVGGVAVVVGDLLVGAQVRPLVPFGEPVGPDGNPVAALVYKYTDVQLLTHDMLPLTTTLICTERGGCICNFSIVRTNEESAYLFAPLCDILYAQDSN